MADGVAPSEKEGGVLRRAVTEGTDASLMKKPLIAKFVQIYEGLFKVIGVLTVLCYLICSLI